MAAPTLDDTCATHTLDRFGASAPGEQLFTQFGFVVEQVVARARELMG